MTEDRCGYNLYQPDGGDYPCDRPAVGHRWYQDVGEHEDVLDVACEIHRNSGGDRIAALLAAVERLTGERDRARGLAARLEEQVAAVSDVVGGMEALRYVAMSNLPPVSAVDAAARTQQAVRAHAADLRDALTEAGGE